MQYGVSTWLWTSPFSTETVSLFPKIKDIGFTHVEIPIENPDIIDGKEVQKALKDNGLTGIACGAFGPTRDLTHDDPKVHDNCYEYIKKCFDLCNHWGAKFLAGPMYSAVGKARLVSPIQRHLEWNRAVENLHKVCVMAAKQDLSIALESLNRFESDLVNTAQDLREMVDAIDHPSAKIALDSFHMTLEERDLTKAIKTAGSDLIHVQVSENYRGAPGSGLTDWQSFKDGLEAIGYNDVISIESFTPNVQELAGAVCVWKPFAESQDQFAVDGLGFLKSFFG